MVKIKKEQIRKTPFSFAQPPPERLLKENLRELTSYIEDFWDFIPTPIILVSPLNIILSISKSFERLSGYNAYEIVGEKLTKIITDKYLIERVGKEIAGKEEILNQETLFLAKEGKEIAVSLSAKKRRDEKGDFIGYFLAILDVSEIKALQESLEKKIEERTRELEEAKSSLEIKVKARTKEIRELADNLEYKVKERTEGLVQSREALINMLEDVEEERKTAEEEKNKTLAIIRNFSDGILVFDAENVLALVNPLAEEFLGTKIEKAIGKSVLELSNYVNFKPLIKIFGDGIKEVSREKIELSEDLILELSTIPVIREKEKVGTLVVLHDITREKLIDKMKTEFVSLAAHQLRTPLSVIKWTLRMILDGDLGEITKEQRDFLGDTYESNERMITLINHLLNVTRIEEGRYIYNLVLADIEELIESVVKSHKEEIASKKIQVVFKKPSGELPKTILDIEKIKIAIDNIFDNALRYTSVGGQIIISFKISKNNIEFSVKDTGVGIPQKEQKRVFAKFFRGTNVIRMETEGTGLGLFITKNIIEAHGGKIWFESKEKVGTTFYFTIPIRKKIPLP